jgi:hypothetical protein
MRTTTTFAVKGASVQLLLSSERLAQLNIAICALTVAVSIDTAAVLPVFFFRFRQQYSHSVTVVSSEA